MRKGNQRKICRVAKDAKRIPKDGESGRDGGTFPKLYHHFRKAGGIGGFPARSFCRKSDKPVYWCASGEFRRRTLPGAARAMGQSGTAVATEKAHQLRFNLGSAGVCTDRGVERSVLSRGIDQYSLQAVGEAISELLRRKRKRTVRSFPPGLGVERPFSFWSHKHPGAWSLMRLRGGACFEAENRKRVRLHAWGNGFFEREVSKGCRPLACGSGPA